MLRICGENLSLCDAMTRREWLRIGGIGVGGLSMPGLLEARASARESRQPRASGKAKSVIIFGLMGGPPQHETWDPKPDAPAEIRGAFGRIATRTPGLFVGELMPKIAQLTDKIAVLRAIATNDNAHSSSGYQMYTGVPHQPLNQESATPKAPNNWPNMGGIMRALKANEGSGRLPAAITIPEHNWNTGGFPWPGQDAGFLGVRHNPWLIHCDPSDPAFTAPDLNLPADVLGRRFEQRRSLLSQVNGHLDGVLRSGIVEQQSIHAQRAFDLLSSGAARKAFDLSQEPARIRDLYGRSRFAQSVLLARRLVEAGVSLIQVNWTRIKDQPNDGGWDTHAQNNKSLHNLLMPIMDKAFSALLENLENRGLLDETLVFWFGEFGRTPRFNGNAGRDHWGSCFSLALAGGGIRGGTVWGASDPIAAYPADGRVEGRDIIATIFHCLGYPSDAEVHDVLGRPIAISRGRVINAIVQ